MHRTAVTLLVLVGWSCSRAPRSSPPEQTAGRAPAETIRLQPINPVPIPGPEPSRIVWDAKITMTLHGAVAEAVITDPQGRRLGHDPGSSTRYGEMSNAVYASTGLGTLRNDSIVGEDPPWTEIYLNTPADGEYQVVIIGTRPGRYILSIAGYDVRHQSSWFHAKDVPIAAGERHTYAFQFSAADVKTRGLGGRRVPP